MEINVRLSASPFDCPRSGGAVSALVRVISCAAAFSLTGATAAKPTVSDTGYEIILGSMPSLYWVDDNRLLFAGIRRADMEKAIAAKEVGRVTRLKKLYVWDDVTKSVRLYANAQGACFTNGVIRYTLRVDKTAGKAIVREGPFGSEKEIETSLPSAEELSTQGQMARTHSKFTCKTHMRSELAPPASRFRRIVVLRDEDGYLDFGPSGGKDYFEQRRAFPRNLTLYQSETGKAVSLPMTWEEAIVSLQVAYSDYRRAYVLRPQMPRGSKLGTVTPWPKDQPLIVYLLWADGRTQTFSIPQWPSEYLGHPQPIKAGWIFGGGKSPKTVALYVFDGMSVAKVESGFVREIAVSPDGCKVAVGINNKPYDMGTPISLKIFDICAGRQ
jgi:hypothetical protein